MRFEIRLTLHLINLLPNLSSAAFSAFKRRFSKITVPIVRLPSLTASSSTLEFDSIKALSTVTVDCLRQVPVALGEDRCDDPFEAN